MGDPIRARKTFDRPSHPWIRARIASESRIARDYGLKNKREIWKAQTVLRDYMARARHLTNAKGPQAEKVKGELISKLKREGLLKGDSPTIDDVLGLQLKDLLDRRLQSIVYRKNLGYTMKQARQLISHGHISVNGRNVTVPGYTVGSADETSILFSELSKVNPTHSAIPQTARAEKVPEKKHDDRKRRGGGRRRKRA